MARKEKLLEKLTNQSSSMTWDELVTLMNHHGFELRNGKRGSTRKFYNKERDLIVRLHEPHPSNTLKPYVKANAITALKQIGVDI